MLTVDESILEWLLEESNPSVRYFTLKELMQLDKNDEMLEEAKRAIMLSGPVPYILDQQNEDGSWEEPDRFYTRKYKGTIWQLMILAELGASSKDEKIQRACQFILNNSYSSENGGFSMKYGKRKGTGLASEVIPCLTGNMIWSLIQLGYLKDARVQSGIEWIVKHQRTDDGIDVDDLPTEYKYADMCFGSHTCFMGVVKSLKALSVIPEKRRSSVVKHKIEELAEFLLIHHLFKQSHQLNKDAKQGWKRFGFPLMYQTDILEILIILCDLGIYDVRMQEAIDVVKKRMLSDGRWKMANTFNGKMVVDIEVKGEPSKWITLRAMKVLKAFEEKMQK